MNSTATASDETAARPQVPGNVREDGAVMCPCGKKCGQAHKGAVEFSCRCGNLVTIDSHIMFLRTCEKGINNIHNIITLMAATLKSAA